MLLSADLTNPTPTPTWRVKGWVEKPTRNSMSTFTGNWCFSSNKTHDVMMVSSTWHHHHHSVLPLLSSSGTTCWRSKSFISIQEWMKGPMKLMFSPESLSSSAFTPPQHVRTNERCVWNEKGKETGLYHTLGIQWFWSICAVWQVSETWVSSSPGFGHAIDGLDVSRFLIFLCRVYWWVQCQVYVVVSNNYSGS